MSAHRISARRAAAATAVALPLLGMIAPAFAGSPTPASGSASGSTAKSAPAPKAPACSTTTKDDLTGVSYSVNGGPALTTLAHHVKGGDVVTATFTVRPECPELTLTLVAYAAKAGFHAADQTIASQQSNSFTGGPHSLTVTLPCMFQVDFVGGAAQSPLTDGYYSSHHKLVDAAAGGAVCTTPPPKRPKPPVTVAPDTLPKTVPTVKVAAVVGARPNVVAAQDLALPFTGAGDTTMLLTLGLGLVGVGALSTVAGSLGARRR